MKIKNLLLITSLLTCSIGHTISTPATHLVYSHGFGESGPESYFAEFFCYAFKITEDYFYGPIYPDAPGCIINKAVFYTKEAVIELIHYLKNMKNNGAQAIHLVGRSCGGGTVLNALAKLIDYENNKDYFTETGITADDAAMILAMINQGSLSITAPLLDIKHAKAIVNGGSILTVATFLASSAILYRTTSHQVKKFISSIIHVKDDILKEKIASIITKAGYLGISLLGYYVFNSRMKNMYINGFTNYILPWLSNYHFDPTHQTPLEALEIIKNNKLTCPTLLHLNKYDEIIDYPNEIKEKLTAAFDNNKMIFIETTDAGHNNGSQQLFDAAQEFNKNQLTNI